MGVLDYKISFVVLPIVLISSIILGIISFNYFTLTAREIQDLAIDDLQTNSEIEVYSISNILSNSILFINSNLERIINSPSILNWNVSGIDRLLSLSLNATNYLTDGYYVLNENGTLVTFASKNKESYSRYLGIDLSHRDYFQIPKQNHTLYISTVIDSNDSVPRIYISLPVARENQSVLEFTSEGNSLKNNSSIFKGVVVASIPIKTLGGFLESQMHPKFNGEVGLIDRDGNILYASNQSFIGTNYFEKRFQSYLKTMMKDREEDFNSIINHALISKNGVQDFAFGQNTTTIAYQAVNILTNEGENNRIGTLFITVPHTLAIDVVTLIDSLIIVNFSIIFVIASISLIVSITLLRWNRILKSNVKQKTLQLSETIDQLEKANEDLKTHDKLQKEFINIAAHELRTPSQAISGNLELIEMIYIPSIMQITSLDKSTLFKEFEALVSDKEKLSDFIRRLVSTYRNSQRLEKLINDILDTSRIESNRLEIHKEYFDLNEKIKNVIKDTAKQSDDPAQISGGNKRIDIQFVSTNEPLIVYADKIRIFEVVSNLLNNAIKFSEGRPIAITVEKKEFTKSISDKAMTDAANDSLTQINSEKLVLIAIRDEGKGIDAEILPRLFTKFATKSNQGTGLGLYIAKSIIEAHGGKIWVNSNIEERGSTFYFTLPLE